MKNKKARLFNLLIGLFILIVLIVFILTYPELAKETGKALAKTTGFVIKKGIAIAKGAGVTEEVINKTINVIG